MADGDPPGIRLTARGGTIEGVRGSSTWLGRAVDRLVEVPAETMPVASGEIVRFLADGPPADDLYLTVFAESSVVDRSLAPVVAMGLDPLNPTWSVAAPPGRYVVALSRTWHETENVVHYFGISAEPGSAG